MKWGRSLTLRVVAYLFVAQLFACIIAWVFAIILGLLGVEDFAFSPDEMAYPRIRDLVIASLVRSEDGSIHLAPTSALLTELARSPKLKYAAFEPSQWRAIPGSSPDLVAALANAEAINPTFMMFSLDHPPGGRPNGDLETRDTPLGRLRITVHGFKFSWKDICFSFLYDFKWLSTYVVSATLLSLGTAWFAVRRGLTPLRMVASEVRRIDIHSLNQRLPDDNVPAEIEPLVGGINDALARLDAGATRLRRFTANAAHELRTPVAILIARLDAPKAHSFLVDLQRDAQRIRNIVEQLLATARLSERPVATAEEVDLVATSRSQAADALLLAVQSGRQITFEAPSAPMIVKGSRSAVASIISNLIDNALRAEPPGGAIIVRVGSDATVAVIDHGEGIAESDRTLIFEPFWRKTEATPGSGLGLAIAKELVEALGGRIWIEETPGGGATFKLWFSLTASA